MASVANVALAAALPSTSAQRATQPLQVLNAWSRATAPGAAVGVVYFEVVNTGAADELSAIESPVAQSVAMHATTTVGGMMEMRPIASVAIPAAGRVVFGPGGLHAMLMELKQPLEVGDRVPLTLVFAHAGRVAAQAVVLGSGAMSAAAATQAQSTPDAEVSPSMAQARSASGYRLTAWPAHAQTPDFTLVDAAGHPRTLKDFRGRVVVIFFGFVHCPDACPAELFKLSLVMQQLGPQAEQVQVLFITLDPARDTRKVLKGYVTAFDSRFAGLTGSAAQIDQAARNFYVVYARVGSGADYTIDHSTSTFLIDATGRLRLIGATTTSVADYAHDLALLATE